MGYRQNNPNYAGGGDLSSLAAIMPLILSGHQPQQGSQQAPGSARPDTGRLTNRDEGFINPTPYVIGGGRGGTYEDEVYPGEYGAGSVLQLLGRLIGGASNVLPIPYGGLIGGAMQRGGNMLGGGQQLEGPPQSVQTPIPRSVVGDGWEHLFRGDSEYFWNSIQPNVRATMWRGGGGGGQGLNNGAFRDSGGWGALAF